MKSLATIRLVIVFCVAFSLAALAAMSGSPELPPLALGRAVIVSNSQWYPAGPEMATLFMPLYVNQQAEFSDIPNNLDFADVPLPGGLGSTFSSGSWKAVTQPQYVGFSQIEFNMASDFWGCPFNFGNTIIGSNGSPVDCGAMIRTGNSPSS